MSVIDFASEEERILRFWKDENVFQECLKQSRDRPRYTFYDGPPFATGLPHYGHILAGTIKDIVTRYYHQLGYYVERRFGWDTHGLPVEYEIDKKLGIKSSADVTKMGIAKYNEECRKIVMRYAGEWEETVVRMGRWIDFKNDYKSLYPWYMESIWWVFKQLFDKGLVYKGFRVMPYSTGCTTPLANFEATLNYQDVQDPSIIVTFPLLQEPDVCFIAWTTTPWTLPSNLALCVHPDFLYVKVAVSGGQHAGNTYILMECRVETIFDKSDDEFKIIERFNGSALKGTSYTPIFEYFGHLASKGAFKVLCDTYVTSECGTGVVQQAPYFGEDDHRVCLANGVISRDQEIVCPLDDAGKFVEPVTDFKGEYVKDADKKIIKLLRVSGRLFDATIMKHSYPFCWRSDTPLLYRAVPSWFLRVECMRERLLARNADTHWVPDSIKDGRFANWLAEARDWNLSRNRYWGTPIPIWISDDGIEVVCVGSIDELMELTGKKERLSDLHREYVDDLTIPSARPGFPPLRRINEVFDCWFESGSMPYAQQHFPFENELNFQKMFPADFIAEGTDQTRGWFYTLLVLSTALFDLPPFKNLIVNGLVLASDGQKMSKRKKNYPDPMIIVGKYGADALRLYLINSPVVRAETLKFKEEGVRDVLKDVFLPWYNAFRFLVQNIENYECQFSTKFLWKKEVEMSSTASTSSSNITDRWIVSFVQSLLIFVKAEMEQYRLYTVIPRLMKFIDNLTNWYVRMNRKRLKNEGNTQIDCLNSLNTLFSVIFTMVTVFAPFTPFLTENLYQKLRKYAVGFTEYKTTDSVHFLLMPHPMPVLVDEAIENAVSRLQSVVELGRVLRDRRTIPIKYPLPQLVVIHKEQNCLDQLASLEKYLKDELNVRTITLSRDREKYGVVLRAEPDHKILGSRLKGAFKDVMKKIKEMTDTDVADFLRNDSTNILGHNLGPSDLRIMYTFNTSSDVASKYEAVSEKDLLVLLDCTPDQAMLDEGFSREIINRIQKMRKKAGLSPSDKVSAHWTVFPVNHDLSRILVEFRTQIEAATKSPLVPMLNTMTSSLNSETHDLKGAQLTLVLSKEASRVCCCSFVNVMNLDGSIKGVVLLENPVGENMLLDWRQLIVKAKSVLGLDSSKENINVQLSDCHTVSRYSEFDIRSLCGKTIVITASKACATFTKTLSLEPCCPFVNLTGVKSKKSATLLLQNPLGVDTMTSSFASQQDFIDNIFGPNEYLNVSMSQ